MKRFASVGARVIAPVCLLVSTAAYAAPEGDLPPRMAPPATLVGASNVMALAMAEGAAPAAAVLEAGKPEVTVELKASPRSTHSPRAVPRIRPYSYRHGGSNAVVVPLPARVVPPGVYKTEPYTCIVVVPGPQADDRFAVSPGGGQTLMPTVRPDLRFVPLRPRSER